MGNDDEQTKFLLVINSYSCMTSGGPSHVIEKLYIIFSALKPFSVLTIHLLHPINQQNGCCYISSTHSSGHWSLYAIPLANMDTPWSSISHVESNLTPLKWLYSVFRSLLRTSFKASGVRMSSKAGSTTDTTNHTPFILSSHHGSFDSSTHVCYRRSHFRTSSGLYPLNRSPRRKTASITPC